MKKIRMKDFFNFNEPDEEGNIEKRAAMKEELARRLPNISDALGVTACPENSDF